MRHQGMNGAHTIHEQNADVHECRLTDAHQGRYDELQRIRNRDET